MGEILAEHLRHTLATVDQRLTTEVTLRDGDPYYATEASTWERTDLRTVAALAAALTNVLDLCDQVAANPGPYRNLLHVVQVHDALQGPLSALVEGEES